MTSAKPPSISIHQQLKANTAVWHSKLDSTAVLRQLIRPELTLAQYVAALQGLLAAHSKVEHQLQQLAASAPEVCPAGLPAYRPRLPALRADLIRLGAIGEIPKAPRQLPTASVTQARAHYIGIRYVLEGASQGGKMLSTRISAQLPQLITQGAFSYWTQLEAASDDWTALSHYLAQPATNTEALTAIITGAETAYQGFIETFQSPQA